MRAFGKRVSFAGHTGRNREQAQSSLIFEAT
jgi:hypothetical protein